jgi:hypothetical protein
MESLKHWLEIITKNRHNQTSPILKYYSHKEISLIVSSLISEETKYPDPVRLKIHPLLRSLGQRGISHNHKSNIAKFIISIIDDYEKDLHNPDCF